MFRETRDSYILEMLPALKVVCYSDQTKRFSRPLLLDSRDQKGTGYIMNSKPQMPLSSSLNIAHEFPKPAHIMAAKYMPTASVIIFCKPIRKITLTKSTPKEEKDDASPQSNCY